MSRPYPLQNGDRAPNLSDNVQSTAADRRPTRLNSVNPPEGQNAAPQAGSPEYPLYPVGSLEPSEFLCAPFPVVSTQGDTSGTGTEIFEIDTQTYGDCYDPHSPVRVRLSEWNMDTDNDGVPN